MDTSTHDSSTTGSTDPGPRRLRRGHDKKIAGVCDGIGRHFDVDPTIVRILFVAAAVLGGSGLVLYLVAWLVMPAPDAPADQGIEVGGGSQNAAGLVALVAGAVLLFWVIGPGPMWEVTIPLLLIGVGVAVLLRDSGGRPDSDPHPDTSPAPTPTPPAPPPDTSPPGGPEGATTDEPADTHTDASPADAEPSTTPGDAGPSGEVTDACPPPPTWAGVPLTPPAPPTPPGAYVPAAPAPVPEPEPPDVDDSTTITPLVLSLLLLGGGVALALHVGDWVDVSALAVVSGGLVVIGAGLIASAFAGTARGLIPLGILFALAVPVTAAVEPAISDGVGDRTYVVDDLADLKDRYDLGIGELVVDLSELDLDGATIALRVDLAIGNAEIILPDDVDIAFTGDVDAGRLEFLGEPGDVAGGETNPRTADGLSIEIQEDFRVDGESNGMIVLDATVDLGNLEVHR